MNLGYKLAEVRRNAQLSRLQLAGALEEKGYPVQTYTLSKWETGVSKPTVEVFLAICEICHVQDIAEVFSAKRCLPLYDLPVSAGSGNYLLDGNYNLIEVDDDVSPLADYALKVSGDSMSPRFQHGQIIYVHRQPQLTSGQIGVFCLNQAVYLKKLVGKKLVSLNPAYQAITVRQHDELTVLGKVIGQ